eukprot:CAMPEP_0182532554 /NCGR_PEP_ID=MMETSP1323-20130603/11895_1 /TAXON_ID=236787 /ORGANISM="Florenciella parvula, Strain RCC1693" /LENGTH=102 /DNA_ID=CAMNT_0024742319 /DNA_START=498 /DNA_END=807 /DNA_ORIENTATION=-
MTDSSVLTTLCCALAEGNGSPFMLVPGAGLKLNITLAMPLLQAPLVAGGPATPAACRYFAMRVQRVQGGWVDLRGVGAAAPGHAPGHAQGHRHRDRCPCRNH